MKNNVCAFLAKNNFVRSMDISSTVSSLLFDMKNGLEENQSDEDMIKTWSNPPKKSADNQTVIVIDAGGTNFRSSLVSFDKDGKPTILELEKTVMPGVEKELGKKDFFAQMAKNLEHLKNKSDRIGFCFSYPMEITPDGDGILIGFSKEVKAPEVVGCSIGKELSDALVENGWNRPKSITLLNDTVAALLAGVASAPKGKSYSSYIGFILGTGLNTAYIQPDMDLQNGQKINEQIVVCESGKFSKLVRSDFDKNLDKKTTLPGTFAMEKQSSGAYLGSVAFEMVKSAASENLFSTQMCKKIEELDCLTTIDIDKFLHEPFNEENKLSAICKTGIENDRITLFELLDSVVERSARNAAALLSAVVIQSGKGKNPSEPVCILCDGTTFHKTYKIKSRCEAYLEDFLFNRNNLSYELTCVDNDITLGAAIAALIER